LLSVAEEMTGRFGAMSDFTNESVSAIETTLNEVDRALERLRLGTYRSCQVCGAAIDDVDVESNPLLANCRTHPQLA
jgi:RNA polymerase-binding transcription factor DksA